MLSQLESPFWMVLTGEKNKQAPLSVVNTSCSPEARLCSTKPLKEDRPFHFGATCFVRSQKNTNFPRVGPTDLDWLEFSGQDKSFIADCFSLCKELAWRIHAVWFEVLRAFKDSQSLQLEPESGEFSGPCALLWRKPLIGRAEVTNYQRVARVC